MSQLLGILESQEKRIVLKVFRCFGHRSLAAHEIGALQGNFWAGCDTDPVRVAAASNLMFFVCE
jgi:hypothetical protein